MAFPAILDITEGKQTSDATVWTLSYPNGCRQNELLIFVLGCDGNPNPTSVTPSDANFVTGVGFGNGMAMGKRTVPAGGISGTFTVTLNAAEQGCWKVLRIGPWHGTLGTNWTNSDANGGDIQGGSYSDATGTAPDPVSFSPFNWDGNTEPTLYLIGCTADGGDTTFTVTPSGGTVVGTNQSSGGATGSALSVYSKQTQVEPYDVGAWTLSASVLYRAWAFAVRGGTFGEYLDTDDFPFLILGRGAA